MLFKCNYSPLTSDYSNTSLSKIHKIIILLYLAKKLKKISKNVSKNYRSVFLISRYDKNLNF